MGNNNVIENNNVIDLGKLSAGEVPERLKVEYYFNFQKHPFRHHDLFEGPEINSVVSVLGAIDGYAKEWLEKTIAARKKETNPRVMTQKDSKWQSAGNYNVLLEEGAVFEPGFVHGSMTRDKTYTIYISKGTRVVGANIFLDEGDIYIGENNIIEPDVGIKAPTIIGNDNEIRQGAYFRGDVIIGDGGTFRGEIKNAVMMDKANFPHPSYVGDSLCGYNTHFGNQATTANLGIYAIVFGKTNVKMKLLGKTYDMGRPKIGIILGDYSQVGCNSVSDPGAFLAPYTIVYQLTRINKGFYGPSEVLKNKPLENKIIERGPLKK